MAFELVMFEIETEGRTIKVNETLEVVDPNQAEVINVYFAEKVISFVDENDGTHTYTFNGDNNTSTNAEKNEVAKSIQSNVKPILEAQNKKVLKLNDIIVKLTESSYSKDDTITFDVYKLEKKKEVRYKKVNEASIANQAYLIAKTKNLEAKKVKVKIHEKDGEFKILADKDALLPILVYANKEDKTTDTEASDWIEIDIKKEKGKKDGANILLTEGDDEIEVGIKKIQLRPKEDKMATKDEEASKSFEGWAEKLYIREDETDDGKKAKEAEAAAEKARNAEKFVTLTRDENADKKENRISFPKKISGPSSIEIAKIATYTITKHSSKATAADKNNIRWSLHIKGDAPTKYTVIDSKSKTGLYTYAKIELIDGKNQLTIIFDKALKGKKVQIEPFRGEPELNTKKEYVSTTLIKEKAVPKVVRKENTKLWLETNCDECEEKERNFYDEKYFILKAPIWYDPLKVMEYRGWYQNGTKWAPERSAYLNYTAYRNKKKHDGLDLYAPVGTPVYACVEGEVYIKRKTSTYGNHIGIKGEYNGKTYYFFYAHFKSSALFEKGDMVKIGDLIGYTGKTGYESSHDRHSHLHFEVRDTEATTGGRLNVLSTIPDIKVNLNINPKESGQP